VRKLEGNRPLGRPRLRWENKMKMVLREVGYGGMDWIELAQDRGRWRIRVNAVMNLRIP
jgi:transposase